MRIRYPCAGTDEALWAHGAGTIVATFDDDGLSGFCAWDVTRQGWLGPMAVRPADRRRGTGTPLVLAALHRMAEQLETRLEALEADDQLMIAVLESLEEGVLAIDERGMVIRINQRARMLLNAGSPLPFPRELLPRDPALRLAVEQALSLIHI